MTDNLDTPPWATALGRLASGIFILTAKNNEQETGMLASWVQQCSFEPPQIILAIKNGRFVLDWVTSEPFVVNILGEEQKGMLSHFGRGFEPGEAAFEGLTIVRSPAGNAILQEGLAWLECEHQQTISVGDHQLVVGKITDGKVLNEGRPMIHVRNNGTHY